MNSYNTDIFFSNDYNLQSVHFEFLYSDNTGKTSKRGKNISQSARQPLVAYLCVSH